MKFNARTRLTATDIKTLELVQDVEGELVADIRAISDHCISNEKVEFHPNSYGEWFFFRGHLMTAALIQADHFSDAYDVYIDECVTLDEQPENEEEAELGYYTGSGKWISEVEQSYIYGNEGIPCGIDFTFNFTLK
tara:strand:- start:268 stop:675 length:408 start_codon:yes stop_codon:yes gene_type:complete